MILQLCTAWKHLRTQTLWLNCDPCNLRANHLWRNQTGFVYSVVFQQRDTESSQHSLPQLILVHLQGRSQNIICFPELKQTDAVKCSVFLKAFLHVRFSIPSGLGAARPEQRAPSPHRFVLVNLFFRNSRTWMWRSTVQTCPRWPRRPPRAARTSTSCL